MEELEQELAEVKELREKYQTLYERELEISHL